MRNLKRCAALLLCLLMAVGFLTEAAAWVDAGLLMRLSTRTGPGTQYDEPGTFFSSDWRTTRVQAHTAAWDNYNDIWWIQVEFVVKGTKYRAYTGLKRVDIDVNTLYQEAPLGTAKMTSAAKAYWGPGRDYRESKYNVPNHTQVTVYNAENGFVQVEFYDGRTAKSERALRRAWVTERAVSGAWSSPVNPPPVITPQPQAQPQTQNEAFSFCPNCGKALPKDVTYSFCPYCGTALTGQAIPVPAPAPVTSGDTKPWVEPGVPITLKSLQGDRLQPQTGPGSGYKRFRSVANNGALLYQRGAMFDIYALFTVNDWVYVSFNYTDGQPRMGWFQKGLFNLGSGIPEVQLTSAKTGIAQSSITPYNGPGTQYGDYTSCRLKAGDNVTIYFEDNGWVFGEFYTTGNNYGFVQLWMPKSKLDIY